MLVTHRVGTFAVIFRKKQGWSKNHNGKKVNCVITECRVLLQTSPPSGQRRAEFYEVSFGKSKQNGLDRHDHVVGKRLALKRALLSKEFHTPDFFPYNEDVLRHLRSYIWRVFYEKFAPDLMPVKDNSKPIEECELVMRTNIAINTEE